jgi:hypothetical protein
VYEKSNKMLLEMHGTAFKNNFIFLSITIIILIECDFDIWFLFVTAAVVFSYFKNFFTFFYLFKHHVDNKRANERQLFAFTFYSLICTIHIIYENRQNIIK